MSGNINLISGKIITNGGNDGSTNRRHYIPTEFTAVMYRMNLVEARIKSAKQYDTSSSNTDYLYVINDTDDIEISDNVWVRQSNNTVNSGDNKIEIFTMNIFSYKLTFIELRKKINQWEIFEICYNSKNCLMTIRSLLG
jgi:hypothetical protein